MICPNKHEPGVECPDCRDFASVWKKLDEFPVPDVSPDFDARLYARIAAEETRRPWWYRLLWPPVAPVAIAAVAAVVLFVHVPGKPDVSKQSGTADIEQVAQAVDDLDLLTPIDR
jgi:hypothetical protein